MRGNDRDEQGAMWSYVPMEQRIPTDHPLRAMRGLVDGVLRDLSPCFTDLLPRRSTIDRARNVLRAQPLQVLYKIRSERLLMEELNYNLCSGGSSGSKWTIPSGIPRSLPRTGASARRRRRDAFFDRMVTRARERGLLSDEHFIVDATLVEAWASVKSFKRKDVPPRSEALLHRARPHG